MSHLPINAAGVHAGADALFKELGEGDLPPFTNPRLDWVATNSVELELLVKSLTFLPWIKIDKTSGRYDAALPRSVLAEAVTAKAFLPPTPEGVAAFDKGNHFHRRRRRGSRAMCRKRRRTRGLQHVHAHAHVHVTCVAYNM